MFLLFFYFFFGTFSDVIRLYLWFWCFCLRLKWKLKIYAISKYSISIKMSLLVSYTWELILQMYSNINVYQVLHVLYPFGIEFSQNTNCTRLSDILIQYWKFVFCWMFNDLSQCVVFYVCLFLSLAMIVINVFFSIFPLKHFE